MIAITFDTRNHGDRMIDSSKNLDWTSDPPNSNFPEDMYSMMLGNVQDVQLLIDMIPVYLNISNICWGIVGMSLGAHSALLTIANGKY